MAVNDPSSVRFCNEYVRVAADTICRAAAAAKAIVNVWYGKGFNALIPDSITEVVEDGAPADGRTQITGADVHRVMEALEAIVATIEGTATNNRTHYANAIKVAVNPTPRLRVEL